LMQY